MPFVVVSINLCSTGYEAAIVELDRLDVISELLNYLRDCGGGCTCGVVVEKAKVLDVEEAWIPILDRFYKVVYWAGALSIGEIDLAALVYHSLPFGEPKLTILSWG